MWFFCKRTHLKEPGKRAATLDEHLMWMKQQHDAGAIVMSGPSPDLKLGLYLIRADSRDAAERIAASDPYTVKGDTTFELIQWNIRQIAGIGPFTAAGLGLADRGL
ncbi:MAG TPA: YciI family protein [Casimicrobiaceae bacterium]|jgi:uncharacterized protein YciI|nr:YciI family protein [Casimicrobiaceae bacterium]